MRLMTVWNAYNTAVADFEWAIEARDVSEDMDLAAFHHARAIKLARQSRRFSCRIAACIKVYDETHTWGEMYQ